MGTIHSFSTIGPSPSHTRTCTLTHLLSPIHSHVHPLAAATTNDITLTRHTHTPTHTRTHINQLYSAETTETTGEQEGVYRETKPVNVVTSRYTDDFTHPNPVDPGDGAADGADARAAEEIRKHQARSTKRLRNRGRGRKPAPSDFMFHHVTTSAANIDRAAEASKQIWGTLNAGFVETKLETTSQRDYAYDYADPPAPVDRTFMTSNPNREYLEARARDYNFSKIKADADAGR
jgi:hypothetical protein